jgi:predicted transposase YdaD
MLRPRAELSNLTGIYQRECEGEPPYLIFRYQMIRVWQLPVERLLQGGVGTLPLAAISAVSNAELPDVIERMRDRLRKRPTAQVKDLWTATYLLMGLRYECDFVNQLLQGVISMEESTTYQAILEKGIAKGKDVGAREELRKVLLLLGQDRFGPASPRVSRTLNEINDLERLEGLTIKLLKVGSWQELLDLPAGRRSRGDKPAR